jgi:hypothetical protein
MVGALAAKQLYKNTTMITFSDGWREDSIQAEISNQISIEMQMNIFGTLKPKLTIIDDGWNCCYGEWPHCFEGTGKTPAQAISDFVNQYFNHKPSIDQIKSL